jgi:hypothetical protein
MDGSSVLGKGQDMANELVITQPYWYKDAWVFDDPSKELEKEPLDGIRGEPEEAERWLAGTSRIIDYLVKDIPNARKGFILLCSSQPIAGYQVELALEGQDGGGYSYKAKDSGKGWWLSPTLLRYFDTAPKSIYVKAEPRRAKYDRIREVVALRDRVEKLEQLVGKLTLENDILRRGKDH